MGKLHHCSPEEDEADPWRGVVSMDLTTEIDCRLPAVLNRRLLGARPDCIREPDRPESTQTGHPAAETDCREAVIGGCGRGLGLRAASRCMNSNGDIRRPAARAVQHEQ
jgi:hypothetical protein